MMTKVITTILLFIFFSSAAQQKERYFATSDEYLEYVDKKHKINHDEMHYFSTANDSVSGNFEKFGFVVLITGNKISTVNEIAEIIKSQCLPKHLFPQLTQDLIQQASTPSIATENLRIKNLKSGDYLIKKNKIALYIFSYRFGNNANLFYKEREAIEKLGYKSVLITIDGAYIEAIKDIDKTPVIIK